MTKRSKVSEPLSATSAVRNLDASEVEARVCRLICEGTPISKIQKILAAGDPPVKMNRQQPYAIFHKATKDRRLQYFARPHLVLQQNLRDRCPWLRDVSVVHSADRTELAVVAADKLLKMISEHRKMTGEPDYHIGFAGGGLLEMTARLLAQMIQNASCELPERLFLHAMVAHFGDNPQRDPNSFLGYFTTPSLPLETRFIGLLAPGFVNTTTAKMLRSVEGIRDAFDAIPQLNAIVTSAGGHWDKGCSYLHEIYKLGKHHAILEELNNAHCVGDLMWRPIGKCGPIELDHGVRAMTLVELNQLPTLIKEGKRVVLLMAPCGTCGHAKPQIADAVLTQKRSMISDLVIDWRCADQVIRAWNSRNS